MQKMFRTSVVCVLLLVVAALLVVMLDLGFVLKVHMFWIRLAVCPLQRIQIRRDGELCVVEETAHQGRALENVRFKGPK